LTSGIAIGGVGAGVVGEVGDVGDVGDIIGDVGAAVDGGCSSGGNGAGKAGGRIAIGDDTDDGDTMGDVDADDDAEDDEVAIGGRGAGNCGGSTGNEPLGVVGSDDEYDDEKPDAGDDGADDDRSHEGGEVEVEVEVEFMVAASSVRPLCCCDRRCSFLLLDLRLGLVARLSSHSSDSSNEYNSNCSMTLASVMSCKAVPVLVLLSSLLLSSSLSLLAVVLHVWSITLSVLQISNTIST
jgi:hypothetical protein